MAPVIPPLDQLTVSGGEALVWGRRTYVMGIVNVSPDSFSGDGLGEDIPAIVDQALRMEAEGADFLDVGAESTRPGHAPITVDEELRRLIPALEVLTPEVTVPVSVDTFKSVVARQALAAGATIINDQWGLQADPEIAPLAAETGAGLILMHNRHHRRYKQLAPEVIAELSESANIAIRAGVLKGNIILDPGFGFGKNPGNTNLEVLRRTQRVQNRRATRCWSGRPGSRPSGSCLTCRWSNGWKARRRRWRCQSPVAPTWSVFTTSR